MSITNIIYWSFYYKDFLYLIFQITFFSERWESPGACKGSTSDKTKRDTCMFE